MIFVSINTVISKLTSQLSFDKHSITEMQLRMAYQPNTNNQFTKQRL